MYLVIKGNDVLVFNTEDELKESGYESDMEISNEEYAAAGGRIRLIDGEIVFGFTQEEKENYARQYAIDLIDAELDALGNKQIRSSAEISEALLKGIEVPEDTKEFHTSRQRRMEELREQRKSYV